jgi:UDP-N-acetylglucosamine 2-epimerase
MKKKVAIIYSNRAEFSILKPIGDKLKDQGVTYECINLSKKVEDIEQDKNLGKIFEFIFENIADQFEKAVVVGDRRECLFACLAFFIKGTPVAQLASGDLSDELATVDDFFRHIITIISNKQIAFSDEGLKLTRDLLSLLNIKSNSTFFSNPTLDGINFENLKRKIAEPYDLVLLHPQSLSREETLKDKETVDSIIQKSLYENQKTLVIVKGNQDKNYDILYDYWAELERRYSDNLYWNRRMGEIKIYENLEKEKFLSLMKYCDRFITNSSCASYEAPIFLKDNQIIAVGRRNKGRQKVKQENPHSAENILNFILS